MVPATLEQAGVAASPANPSVELLQLNPQNAELRVLTRIASAQGHGELTFTPSIHADKAIFWACRAKDINPQALPAECR